MEAEEVESDEKSADKILIKNRVMRSFVTEMCFEVLTEVLVVGIVRFFAASAVLKRTENYTTLAVLKRADCFKKSLTEVFGWC